MFAIATLTFEHRIIDQALVALDRLASEVGASGRDGREELAKLLGFVDAFVEQIHHPKEVGILMAHFEREVPEVVGPIAATLGEHSRASRSVEWLETAAGTTEPWTPADADQVARTAAELTAHWREHMAQEERLFSMAGQRLGSECSARIEKLFDEHAAVTAAKAEDLCGLAASVLPR